MVHTLHITCSCVFHSSGLREKALLMTAKWSTLFSFSSVWRESVHSRRRVKYRYGAIHCLCYLSCSFFAPALNDTDWMVKGKQWIFFPFFFLSAAGSHQQPFTVWKFSSIDMNTHHFRYLPILGFALGWRTISDQLSSDVLHSDRRWVPDASVFSCYLVPQTCCTTFNSSALSCKGIWFIRIQPISWHAVKE